MAGWILNCWPTWHSSRLASKAGRKDTSIYKNNLSWNFGFSFVLSLEEAVIRMAGAVSRLKSTMNEQVVSFCLLGVLFWMPHIYAFLICRIWPSSECSKQSNLFLLPVTDYIYGTVVATSCDLNAPRCTTTVPQVRLHGSRGGVFVGHRPPRDPGDPLQLIEVLHLLRWYTHTLAQKYLIELLMWNASYVPKHSSKPDRNDLMIRSEKLCEGNLSTSLLEGYSGSDAAHSDCENRAKRETWKSSCLKTAWWFLG